ncbi:MAG: FliO/MopB family protein [Cellvibrionaceae bacterium]
MKKLILLIHLFIVLNLSAFDLHAEGHVAGSPVSYSANIMQMMMGLFFIVIMIFGVVWLMKKVGYQGYSASGLIKVKSCLPISTKEKILLIEVGGEQVLVGTAPGFIGHIKTIDKPIKDSSEAAFPTPPAASAFADKLKKILNKNEMIE